jgi:hypothetical protein
LVKWN